MNKKEIEALKETLNEICPEKKEEFIHLLLLKLHRNARQTLIDMETKLSAL